MENIKTTTTRQNHLNKQYHAIPTLTLDIDSLGETVRVLIVELKKLAFSSRATAKLTTLWRSEFRNLGRQRTAHAESEIFLAL